MVSGQNDGGLLCCQSAEKGPELTPEPVREWDEGSVELRDDELLLIAAGEKPPSDLEEAKSIGFSSARDVARNDTRNREKSK